MSVLMEQGETVLAAHYGAVRDRLMNGVTPLPRQAAPRPVSPFVREIRAQREAAAKAEAVFREERARARAAKEHAGPHWSQIVHQVAKKHKLKAKDILGPSRFRVIVTARNEAFYRMRTEILVSGLPMSYPAIGRRFGGMDHTSVLHGVRKHAESIGVELSPAFNTIHRHQNKTGVATLKSAIAP